MNIDHMGCIWVLKLGDAKKVKINLGQSIYFACYHELFRHSCSFLLMLLQLVDLVLSLCVTLLSTIFVSITKM